MVNFEMNDVVADYRRSPSRPPVPIHPIPNIFGELLNGCYGHGFIRQLTGPLSEGNGGERALALEQILDHEGGSEALTAMVVVGVRSILNLLAEKLGDPDAIDRALENLAAALDDTADLDAYAATKRDLFQSPRST